MLVRSSASTRIDLAGGTLDIWPLYLFHPGAQTVNAALGLRARCEVRGRADGRLELHSDDTGLTLDAANWRAVRPEGEWRLLAHIVRFFEIDGVRIVTRSDSPVGAGIAGSSALTLAVCAALARWQERALTDEELLTLAMNLEARTLGIPTGVQDYRPALYGGISAVELGPLGVRRVALDVDPADLERRLVLAYSGDSRSSGLNNWDITRRHIEGDTALAGQLGRIRDCAVATRAALVAGDWDEVARQMQREWTARQALAPGVTTPAIEGMLAAAGTAGAQAGKVCGAGGGGCVCVLIDPARRAGVCAALVAAGARLLECRIDQDGLQVDVHDG